MKELAYSILSTKATKNILIKTTGCLANEFTVHQKTRYFNFIVKNLILNLFIDDIQFSPFAFTECDLIVSVFNVFVCYIV